MRIRTIGVCGILTALVLVVVLWRQQGSRRVTRVGQYNVHWLPLGAAPFSGPPHHLNDAGEVAVDVAVDEEPWWATRAGVWQMETGELQLVESLARRALDFEDTYTTACAINAAGHVVGQFCGTREISLDLGGGPRPLSAGVFSRGFFWTPDRGVINLPWFTPADLNDSDQVVGSGGSPGSGVYRAILWTPDGGLQALGALTADGESFAVAINEKGWIAGNATGSDGKIRPILWKDPDELLDLGLPTGLSEGFAQSLNDQGDVLVNAYENGFQSGAGTSACYLWRAETGGYRRLAVSSDYENVSGIALTNDGVVLVSASQHDLESPTYFLVSDTTCTQLPTVSTTAETRYDSMNESGWLVGFTFPSDSAGDPNHRRGFLAVPAE